MLSIGDRVCIKQDYDSFNGCEGEIVSINCGGVVPDYGIRSDEFGYEGVLMYTEDELELC